MFPIFSNHKTKLDAPEKLFFFLDKIINISLIKIERGEIKSAINILKDLELFLKKFWTLKQKNPGRFLSLVSSQEIYENACPIKMPGHFYEENSFDTQNADNLKVQTLLYSQAHQGKELKGFARLLTGFEKIWERAFHWNQVEITSAVFQILDHFLTTLLERPYNDIFVESVLRLYLSILERILKSPNNTNMEYEIRQTLLWYQKYQLNRETLATPFDDFPYEDLLDQTLYKMILLIVSAKPDTLDIFLSILSEKTDILSQTEHSLLDIFHILEKGSRSQYEIFKKQNFYLDTIEKLNLELSDLDSLSKIRNWISREQGLLEQIRPYLEISQIPHFNELETDIQKYLLYLFKKQKILEIIDAMVAFSLVRNKPFVIKAVFSYRLPYDTIHAWFIDFILPKTLLELLLFLNKKQKTISKYNISDGLRVHESFYEKSSLILISAFLLRLDDGGTGLLTPAQEFTTTMSGTTLNSIRCIVTSLISASHQMSKEQNYLSDLGLSDDMKTVHWKEHMIPFLQYILSSINQKVSDLMALQKISPAKLEDFRIAIAGSYQKNSILRKIFNKLALVVMPSENPLINVSERVGINVIDDKAQFLEQWEDACSLQILDYGIKLASSEDLFVFNAIRRQCKQITWVEWETMIQNINLQDYLMIVTDLSYQGIILKKAEFSPLWIQENQTDIDSQIGEYLQKSTKMPVIVLTDIKDEEGILIVDKTKLGHWNQYSPLNPGDDTALLKEYLYINVQAFSEKEDLLKEFLQNPPAWLRDLGSSEKQKTYLLEHILVHIFERFEWIPGENFNGLSIEDSL